jgi:hypothetical protein
MDGILYPISPSDKVPEYYLKYSLAFPPEFLSG